MTDWHALQPGDEITVMDSDDAAKILKVNDHVYVIKREFDGAWQDTVWIRPVGGAWGVARTSDSLGTPADSLEKAIDDGIHRSREALNRYRPGD